MIMQISWESKSNEFFSSPKCETRLTDPRQPGLSFKMDKTLLFNSAFNFNKLNIQNREETKGDRVSAKITEPQTTE